MNTRTLLIGLALYWFLTRKTPADPKGNVDIGDYQERSKPSDWANPWAKDWT